MKHYSRLHKSFVEMGRVTVYTCLCGCMHTPPAQMQI